MLFTLKNQRSHRRKALITKIIWKKITIKRMPCLPEVEP
jgi:hypothetical protein